MADENKSEFPTLDLDDALRETLEAADQGGEEASKDEGGGEVAAAPETEAADEVKAAEDGADDQGDKEAAEETSDGDGEADDAAAETGDDEDAGEDDASDDDGDEEADDDKSDLEAFSHLPVEQRDAIAKLDRTARDAVHDRMKFLEGNADKKFKEASDLRKKAEEQSSGYKEFDRVLKPYDKHLAEAGLTPAQAVGQVLALRDGLITDPVGGLTKIVDEFLVRRGEAGSSRAQQLVRQIATRLRVDLDGLDDLDETQATMPSPEAELIAQRQANEYQSLRDEFETLKQSQQSGEVKRAQLAWESFKDDPANEHAERLEGDITGYLGLPKIQEIADPRKKLEEAYKMAKWADSETREQLLAAKEAELREQADKASKAAEEQRRAKLRKVSTTKAKAASTTPKATAPTLRTPDTDLDFGDHMKSVFDDQNREGASRV